MSDRKVMIIDTKQFARFDLLLESISNALWAINDRLVSMKDTVDKQTVETTKWQSLQKEALEAGLEKVAQAVANIQSLPQPQPKPLEARFVFKVSDDHQSEQFSISIGGVTDAEGQPISDPSGLSVKVESSDENVVSVQFDDASKSGSVSFGSPGVASVTATVTNSKGDILGSGAADFTVTTGDPAAVSDVKLAFSGLTEEPPATPTP